MACETREVALIPDRFVGERSDGVELLATRRGTGSLPPLEGLEFLQIRRISGTTPVSKPRKAKRKGCVDPDQDKTRRPVAQGLHLRRMAYRIDHIAAVGAKRLGQPQSECRGSVFRAQRGDRLESCVRGFRLHRVLATPHG